MRVFWIVFATVYILGWVWLCYSAMHAPSDLDLWGEEIEYVLYTLYTDLCVGKQERQ